MLVAKRSLTHNAELVPISQTEWALVSFPKSNDKCRGIRFPKTTTELLERMKVEPPVDLREITIAVFCIAAELEFIRGRIDGVADFLFSSKQNDGPPR